MNISVRFISRQYHPLLTSASLASYTVAARATSALRAAVARVECGATVRGVNKETDPVYRLLGYSKLWAKMRSESGMNLPVR